MVFKLNFTEMKEEYIECLREILQAYSSNENDIMMAKINLIIYNLFEQLKRERSGLQVDFPYAYSRPIEFLNFCKENYYNKYPFVVVLLTIYENYAKRDLDPENRLLANAIDHLKNIVHQKTVVQPLFLLASIVKIITKIEEPIEEEDLANIPLSKTLIQRIREDLFETGFPLLAKKINTCIPQQFRETLPYSLIDCHALEVLNKADTNSHLFKARYPFFKEDIIAFSGVLEKILYYEASRYDDSQGSLLPSIDEKFSGLAKFKELINKIENNPINKLNYFLRNSCEIPLHTAILDGDEKKALDIIDSYELIEFKNFILDEYGNIYKNNHEKTDVLDFPCKIQSNSDACSIVYLDPSEDAIQNGKNSIFEQNKEYKSALHLAAERGMLPVIKRLLEKEISVDLKDIYGRTALHYAVLNGNEELIKYLVLEQNASVNVQDLFKQARPLDLLYESERTYFNKDIFRLLNEGKSLTAVELFRNIHLQRSEEEGRELGDYKGVIMRDCEKLLRDVQVSQDFIMQQEEQTVLIFSKKTFNTSSGYSPSSVPTSSQHMQRVVLVCP